MSELKNLGYLEETILLLILSLETESYGLAVKEAYEEHVGKRISLSAIHSVLSRLEKKGFLESQMGQATEERGGRRKRLFTATDTGMEIIAEIRASRQKLWQKIPGLS